MNDSNALPDPPEVDPRLARAGDLVDVQPQAAREVLRDIDATDLSETGLSRFAVLLNQVFGRTLGLWDEALAGHTAVLRAAGDAASSTLLLQAAVAAQVAGDAALAPVWVQAFADAAQATPNSAAALVTLSAVTLSVARQDAETAGRLTLQVLQPLASLQARPVPTLDPVFGEVTRDLARHLLERPLTSFDLPELRMALALTAQHSERFWRRCGRWADLHHAYQLRAQAANTLGEGLHAAAHAREGLAVLDKHDAERDEDGSRAFLQLELAQGLRLAGEPGSEEAQRDAEQLAALFEDTAQIRLFAQRMQRHADLTQHYGRH